MSIDTAKKLLKVFGVLDIIGGVLMVIVAVIMLGAGGLVAGDPALAAELGGAEAGQTVLSAGIGALDSAAISVIAGVFSLWAAKDSSKYKGTWIMSLFSLGVGAIGLFLILVFHMQGSIISEAAATFTALATFLAANTVKKDALSKRSAY